MIEHDRLFKELLSTFFLEFLDLFLPEIARQIEPGSLTFLPQEYFADLTAGDKQIVDLLAQVRLAGQEMGFLIHVENQSFSEADFCERMFLYFSRLFQKYRQPVYPVVVFSFDEPLRAEPNVYTIEFPGLKVLEFKFAPIQLNQLNWRDYLRQPNPVAAALMSKMRIAPADRPKVKAECLRSLVTLRLDPARTELISGFVDTYLQLNAQEEQVFQGELGRLEGAEQEEIMQIVTSWMQKGIEQGIEQGEKSLILRQLERKLGTLSLTTLNQVEDLTRTQLEQLGESLLEFSGANDLEQWLRRNLD
jgi:Domain of unknown function (DUF4351)/Putative transposase, YhgA-like